MRLKVTTAPTKHADAVAAAGWVTPPATSGAAGPVSLSAASTAPSLITCADDGTWNQYSHEGEFLGTLVKGNEYGVCDISVAPSQDTLAAACADGTLRFFVVSRSDAAASGSSSSAAAAAARAAVDRSGGRLLSVREERKVVASSGGEGVGAVTCVRWSPDGGTVATGGEDGCVKVWSRAGMMRTTLVTAGRPIYAVAWSADGGSVLYACGRDLCIVPLGDGPVGGSASGGAGGGGGVAAGLGAAGA